MIEFKGKVTKHGFYDKNLDYIMKDCVKIPVFTRSHCNMQKFRDHPKYGTWANSDLFPNVLAGIRRDIFGESDYLDLEKLPANVTVKLGFFVVVTINL